MLLSGAKIPSTFGLAIATFLLASTASEATARMVAHSASDLCPDDADPCMVNTQVIVPENTTLDFGTRTLEIAESGSLRLVREDIVIRAGRIVVAPRDGVAIRQVTRGSKSVDVSFYAMRTCSAGSARCLDDDDCVGGQCSVGEGSVEINGEVRSAAREYARLKIIAAGSITVDAPVTMALPTPDSYSDLVFESLQDSVVVRGGILHQSDDAWIDLFAKKDAILEGKIVMPGGSWSYGYGGTLSITAHRDAVVREDIDLSSRRGANDGGEIDLYARGRAVLDGGDAENPIRLKAIGARGTGSYGGYGGGIWLTGVQEVIVGRYVQLEARSGTPREGGARVVVEQTQHLAIGGQIDVSGTDSRIRLDSDHIEIAPSARLSVDSLPELAGGAVEIHGCSVQIAGQISLGEGLDGDPGDLFRPLDILAGDLRLSTTARITGAQTGRPLLFQASGSMLAEAGSVIDNPAGGNNIVYRDLAQAPVLSGLFTPAPNLTLDPTLSTCTP